MDSLCLSVLTALLGGILLGAALALPLLCQRKAQAPLRKQATLTRCAQGSSPRSPQGRSVRAAPLPPPPSPTRAASSSMQIDVQASAISAPLPEVPYLHNYRNASTRARSEDIGRRPAWGKEGMRRDIMWTSMRAGRASLDAFEPMERVALNASGTFQRTVSSYYNAPVYVETDYNDCASGGKCHRQVTMSVGGYEFAVCTSYMEVTRPDLIDAVENKGIAIGQLFRHFEMMPIYALLAAGLDEEAPDRFIWRVYKLTVEGAVMCRIHEKIRRDVFDLQLAPGYGDGEERGGPGMDVVKPNVTYMELPEGFSQLERILITANANIERIISSYYNLPTIVHVMQNYRREPCVFERKTAMLLHGEEFMYATATVFLADQKWEECMVNNHKAGLGQVFTMMGVQPTFKLRDAGRTPHSFWRTYTLSCSAVTVQITETFNMYIFALAESADSNEYKFVYASEAGSEAEGGTPIHERDTCADVFCSKWAQHEWQTVRMRLSAARALTHLPWRHGDVASCHNL